VFIVVDVKQRSAADRYRRWIAQYKADRFPLVSTNCFTGATMAADGVDRPLRIAQVAPLAESVPPRLYGGTERIVSYLTEALVDRGHEVTLLPRATR
jgi:hypothetical protein